MPFFSKAAPPTAATTIADLLPPDYGYVLVVAALLVLENLVLGSMVMKVRKQVFTSKEFEANAKDLMEQHKKAFPKAQFALGYPDMGSGLYSHRLSYADWYRFNNAQRGHQNFLETAWGVFGLIFSGGIFDAKTYAALGAVFVVARFIYMLGYTSDKGPKGREAGAILGALSVLGLVFYTIYNGVMLVKAAAGK